MPTFEFTSPDGKTYHVDGPEGATNDQAFQVLQQGIKSGSIQPLQAQSQPRSKKEIDQEMINDKLKTAIGGAEADLMVGSGMLFTPLSGLAGIAGSVLPGKEGQGADWANRVAQTLQYQPRSEGGKYAEEALGAIGSLGRMAGETVVDKTGSPLLATIADVGVNAIPNLIGARRINKAVPKELTALEEARQTAVKDARKEGYVLPPTQIKDTAWNSFIEGIGGKIKTAQEASVKNETVTGKLIRKGLGLPEDVPINNDTLDIAAADATKHYENIKAYPSEMKTTFEYHKAIDNLGDIAGNMAQKFPNIFKNQSVAKMKDDLHVESMTPTEAIELTKKLRRDANDYLAHGQSPENKTIGRAYRQASDAIENMIEANLKDTENEHLLANFRDGRKQLAKIESVRRALTGNDQVDARKLYAQHKAKVPLTDELKTVAKFAGRWPKAAQTTEKMGSVTKVSPLDVATGLLGGIKTASAALVGRPVVRGGALTQFGQNQFVKALDKTSPFGISDDSLVRQLGELSNPIAGTAQQQRQQ